MENVAHALAGLLLAELALRVTTSAADAQSGKRRRVGRAAYWVSALANNVPDADIVYLSITPGKLGYLLHHRGHTHTLVLGTLLGVAVALGALVIARLRRQPFARADSTLLLSLGAVGPVLHILMDSWNNYGVHPFWPVSNRWFYGDAIFIVEPLLWLSALPPLFALARSRAWRLVLAALFAIMLALPWLVPELVPLAVRLTLVGVAALVAGLTYFVANRWRVFVALGGWALVFGAFAIGSTVARGRIDEHLRAAYPNASIHDVALTPMPGDPLCWTAVSVLTLPDGDFLLHHATVAAAPALVEASACPASVSGTTATLGPASGASGPAVRASGEFRGSTSELAALVARRCDVAAAMRFMRAPYWKLEPGRLIVGDGRYDRDEAIDFADVELPADDPVSCPRHVPPWVPPREDVLGL